VRSAVYRAAAPAERRRVRAALAEATDPRVDPDRAHTAYLEALDAARFAGPLARGADFAEVSKAGAGRRRPAPAAAADRSPPSGDCDAAHRWSRRGRADPQGRAERGSATSPT